MARHAVVRRPGTHGNPRHAARRCAATAAAGPAGRMPMRAPAPPAPWLQPSALLRRHRLKLVTTSKVCDLRLREPPANPAAALELGDAMAADPAALLQEAGAAGAEAQAAAGAAAGAEALTTVDLAAAAAGAAPDAAGRSPVDAVAASLSAAAAAASAAASSAAQGVYTAAVPYAGAGAKEGSAAWCFLVAAAGHAPQAALPACLPTSLCCAAPHAADQRCAALCASNITPPHNLGQAT